VRYQGARVIVGIPALEFGRALWLAQLEALPNHARLFWPVMPFTMAPRDFQPSMPIVVSDWRRTFLYPNPIQPPNT